MVTIRRPLAAAARWHPSATFGLVGGQFALPSILTASDGPIGDRLPTEPETIPVVGGVVGGALVSWALRTRLGATDSPRRGAVVGAPAGPLALPVPFPLLELAVLALDGPRSTRGPACRRRRGRSNTCSCWS